MQQKSLSHLFVRLQLTIFSSNVLSVSTAYQNFLWFQNCKQYDELLEFQRKLKSRSIQIKTRKSIPFDANDLIRSLTQIMAVNDVDLRRASHDEAAAALKATAGSGRQVRLTVQYRPEDYNRYEARLHEIQQTMTGTLVRTSPKRTLYVRALFDYDPAKARMLSKGHSRERTQRSNH